jgi:hypothetical protein
MMSPPSRQSEDEPEEGTGQAGPPPVRPIRAACSTPVRKPQTGPFFQKLLCTSLRGGQHGAGFPGIRRLAMD